MEQNTTPERRCPACGAAIAQDARFCGACGMEALPVSTTEAMETTEAAAPGESGAQHAGASDFTPPAAPAASAPMAAAQPLQAPGPGERICPWCAAVNVADAARCASCGAVFPTPEGNAALERAAQARIQSMESELKQRRSGWWPFRSRQTNG